MPELPEVETTRRGIEPHILGKKIRDVPYFVKAVSHSMPGGPLSARIDRRSGEFSFSSLLFGTYILWATAEGYAPTFGVVEVPMNGRFDLGLEPAGTIRLRIMDPYARRLDPIAIQNATLLDPCAPDPEVANESSSATWIRS